MTRLLIALMALLAAAGCARGAGAPGGTDPSAAAKSVPPEAFVLLPDGSVPWVDEPITDRELHGLPTAPRTPGAGSKPCRAQDLSGVLAAWSRPGNGGETPRGFDAAIVKLIGMVEVRNTSRRECTLQGEVPTRMLAGGQQVPMSYSHGINADARRRVIVVPPGERASLRLDWSGPFCAEITGPLELAIELPGGGGTLRAPVTPKDTPNCARGEAVKPNARAFLSSDGFSEFVVPSRPSVLPFGVLTVTVTGPATVKSGGPLTYHVTLTNPTGGQIPLEPCPGYAVTLFSTGDATNAGVNSAQLYRLNCRPAREVAGGGSLRFEMIAQVPAGMAAGRELNVTWKLLAPHFNQGPNQWGEIKLRIE